MEAQKGYVSFMIDPEAPGAQMPGVAALREQRGQQRARFDEVADHIVDYAGLHPETAAVLDRFASFLAEVEDEDHAHDGSGATAAGPAGDR